MSSLYRIPSNDDSYQISIHLAKQLQRGRFFLEQELPVGAMFVNGLRRNEQAL
jgi:hypothetical protein